MCVCVWVFGFQSGLEHLGKLNKLGISFEFSFLGFFFCSGLDLIRATGFDRFPHGLDCLANVDKLSLT